MEHPQVLIVNKTTATEIKTSATYYADGLTETTTDARLAVKTAHRLVSQTDVNGFAVGYKYDENSNLTELTYPGNKKVIYTYTALNQLETVTIDWLSQTATYNYDDAGRLTGLTNFNGTVTTYGYDN
ncbi:MAG: hypothetical protein C4560_07885, partial [Nitrospiraceae bacterium]